MNPDEQSGTAPESAAETGIEPVSIDQQTTFEGPLSIDQLGWIGAGILALLILLTIRDSWLARKKWVVPFLLILRTIACAGILLALAAPTTTTTRTYEIRRGLGIYLDGSASMGLRDPVDGKGHLERWRLATADRERTQRSPLAAIDGAAARAEVALALTKDAGDRAGQDQDALKLLSSELQRTLETIRAHEKSLPFPSLAKEVMEAFSLAGESEVEALLNDFQTGDPEVADAARVKTFQTRLAAIQLNIDEAMKRLAVIARELARREEISRTRGNKLAEGPSRLEWAGSLLRQIEESTLEPAAGDLNVTRTRFADRTHAVNADWKVAAPAFPEQHTEDGADAEFTTPLLSTDLNAVLDEISSQYRDGKIDAAILVTDAVHNNRGLPLEIPPGMKDFPLFLVPAGGDYKLDDVTLWRASAPDTLIQGDFLSVDCLVGARGYPGQTTRLRLLKNGKELDGVDVTFGDDGSDQQLRLSAPVTDAGSHRFEIEVAPLPGELHTENNRETIDVSVFTGDLKVLLVDGWPRWETRYLSNLLKRDDTVEHREILFAPDPPEFLPDTLSSSEELKPFNIVILGEVSPEFIGPTEIEALENYVDDGGNLIVLAGRESMPADYTETNLAEILPVRLDVQRRQKSEGFQLIPTAAGRRIAALNLEDARDQNNAVWRLGSTLLPLAELSPFNVPKPAAQVILEARSGGGENTSLPYVVWHRYGGGRVFYFPSPTTYHLRYRFGDRYHYRFWGQFLRWATMAEMHGGNSLIQISPSAKRYREKETPRINVELRDIEGEPVTGATIGIRLERSGAEVTEYPCAEVAGKKGLYTVALPALAYGEYRVSAFGPELDSLLNEVKAAGDKDFVPGESGFVIEARPSTEAGDRNCDWKTAQRLVDSTAGAIIPPDGLQAAIDVLTLEGARSRHETVTRVPLWNRWPLFFLILIFLTVEWAGRKYAGLI